jgi:bacteriocin-like protein
MSDDFKQINEEELDKIAGGVTTHPMPRDPIKPGGPPTHPGLPVNDPISRGGKTQPG